MIQSLADTMETTEGQDFFARLKVKVQEDRDLLEHLLTSADMKASTAGKVAGDLAARVGFIKLAWEGFKPGELGIFEALEMLALGIQGKRLLWLALKEISVWFPEWQDIDFSKLELEAIEQRDGVELWRIEAALDSLPGMERRKARASVG